MEEDQSRQRSLPSLPGSTEEDLRSNQFSPFFKKTARNVWDQAEIHHTTIKKDVNKCDHYFSYVKSGVRCGKCNMGLEGQLDIKEGKLFYKGQKLLG